MRDAGPVCFVELMIGLLLLVSCGVFLGAGALPKESSLAWRALAAFSTPILWAVCWIAVLRGLKILHERVIVPRRAMVVPDRAKGRRYSIYVIVVGILLAVGISRIDLKQRGWLIGVGVAIIFALSYLFLGMKSRWPELFCLAAFAAGLGIWMCRARGGIESTLGPMLWLGAATLLAGTLRLRSFVKANPIGHV